MTAIPQASSGRITPCSEGRSCRRLLAATITTLLALAALVIAASPAGAAIESGELTSFGSAGSMAGQLKFSQSIAADPITGNIYVGGFGNNRIDEFTPWGEFIKAFGFGVAPEPVNEQQEVRVRAAAGQFKLNFGASTTAGLPFDAGAEEVETALDGLASIQSGGGSVSVVEIPGSPEGSTPYVYILTFKGSLAGTDVNQVLAADGSTPLSGGSPSTALEVRTRANGTAGGTGLESCTAESGCQPGLAGAGAGQPSNDVFSVAVDAGGDVYTAEIEGFRDRVQKFSSSGEFLLMFGGEVNKTEVRKRNEQEAKAEPVTVTAAEENLCTAASGNECGAGTPGTGHGQFSATASIALGSTGAIFVGDTGRIERFNPEGEYESEIPVPGETIRHIAVGPTNGDLYVDYQAAQNEFPLNTKEKVHELDPATGAEVGVLEVRFPESIVTDSVGNIYVTARERLEQVLEFNSSGSLVAELATDEERANGSGGAHELTGLGTGPSGDLYVANVSPGGLESFVRVFGPPPITFQSPPKVPPTIAAQYAASVDTREAELRVQINPHFWTDTTYYLEYGTAPCSEGGCKEQPAAPGDRLTSRVTGVPVVADVRLSGLLPGSTYHYRFVSQSSGGGPAVGLRGEGGEGTFTTFRVASAGETGCPNERLRGNLSAQLPDCRAYEMVTPLEKDNGDVVALEGFRTQGLPAVLEQSATSGEKLAYGSYRAFGDAESAPFTSQYIAARGNGGWSSHAISPPHGSPIIKLPANTDTEFRAFSPDLCQAWFESFAEPPLAAGAPEGFSDLYRRHDQECGGRSYEALNTTQPTVSKNTTFRLALQGVAADGAEAIYVANARLTPEATAGQVQLYEQPGGEPKLVCILPGGKALKTGCTAGESASALAVSEAVTLEASLSNAISTDGSRVFWTASAAGPGKIYMRENAFGTGEECAEASSACTIVVSQQAETDSGTNASTFLTAAADGSKAIFATGASSSYLNDLYEIDVADETTHLIAHKVEGLMGASSNASLIYFASEEVLTGAGVNGKSPTAGEPNLYLYRAGATTGAYTFIGTLSKDDVSGFSASPVSVQARYHAARVSADGLHAVFESPAELTGYDNSDVESGDPDTEVYLFDASANGGAGSLVCASCNPSGSRPEGQAGAHESVSGQIPGSESMLYASRVLSDDSSRIFFDSYDALVPQDTNGEEDVYEWEKPADNSGCEVTSSSYSPLNGGCVNLISSGQSTRESEFVDASPDGNDAFFATLSSLVPQDPGLVDIYDARVNGGFPTPASPVLCEGEACQNPAQPPSFATPASTSFDGAGNLQTPMIPAIKAKAKMPTTAQKLAAALRACGRKPKKQRPSCEAQARKKYGKKSKGKAGKPKGKAKKSNEGGRR
jgi:hypothetical protein